MDLVPFSIKVILFISLSNFFVDKIYMCGGNDGNNILNTFEAYDVKKEKW